MKRYLSYRAHVDSSSEAGLSMIEVLIVLAILIILLLIWFAKVPDLFDNARDGQRKSDLDRMQIALEDYAGDNGCYPEVVTLSTCGHDALQPYLKDVPCDPQTDEPYFYTRSPDCLSYGLFTTLENPDDPTGSSACAGGCGPDLNGDGVGEYSHAVVGGNTTIELISQTAVIPPTCGTSTKFCIANSACGTCCPGSVYRCNSTGSGCVYDMSCN